MARAIFNRRNGKRLQINRNRLHSWLRRGLKGRTLSKGSEGAELLEFALALPLILVMVVGLLDFATAYNLRQKLANAAREGARLGSSQNSADITTSSPNSVQSIKDDVTTYLLDAGVNTSFIGTTISAVGPNMNGCCVWTYYSTGTYGLKIERQVPIPSGGTNLPSVRVTLNYPYDWTFGFNHVIKLMAPSATSVGTINISANATMVNLAN